MGGKMDRIIVAVALGFWGLSGVGASADDWIAGKLRGQVLQLIDNQWQPLDRGAVVPDSRVVRTLHSGMVTFARGNETLQVGPDTQIQIFDKGGSKPFTTVKQYFGSVSVEAEVQQVQHFAVQTPYLAAVVKGTRFTVSSGKGGASVEVRRGHVAVEDKQDKTHVMLAVGQSASVDIEAGGALQVAGRGKLPVVLTADGKPVASPPDPKTTVKQPKPPKTPEAKDALKAAQKLDKQAHKDAKDAAKDAEKAGRDAAKADKDAAKEAEKAEKDAAKSGPSGPGSGSSGPGSADGGKGKGKKD